MSFHVIRTRVADNTIDHVAFGRPSRVGEVCTSRTFPTEKAAWHEAAAWISAGEWTAEVKPGRAPRPPCKQRSCARLSDHTHDTPTG